MMKYITVNIFLVLLTFSSCTSKNKLNDFSLSNACDFPTLQSINWHQSDIFGVAKITVDGKSQPRIRFAASTKNLQTDNKVEIEVNLMPVTSLTIVDTIHIAGGRGSSNLTFGSKDSKVSNSTVRSAIGYALTPKELYSLVVAKPVASGPFIGLSQKQGQVKRFKNNTVEYIDERLNISIYEDLISKISIFDQFNGTKSIVTEYSDYFDFNGLKFPSKIKLMFPKRSIVIELSIIKFSFR